MEFFRRLQEQLRQIWLGLSPARRIALVGTVLLSVGLIAAVVFWAGQTEYRPLYSGLSPEDAGAVTAKLQAQTIPYRLDAGGTTILVPAERLAQARVDLATEGLPTRPGKGFELFDESPLGMTPFTQQVNYQRALQAELARTIMQIEPVAFARVIIARPESSPFVRDQKAPTASVVLRLKSGGNLSRSTASGIAALVARSVEGLTPENVTIMDASGRMLSEPATPDAGVVATQLDYRRSLETYLAQKAEGMLAQVLGPGRAIVRVDAAINFQRSKERRETVNPEQRAVTAERITNSKTTSGPPGARGPAGTASNVPSRALGTPGVGGAVASTSQDESISTDYAVTRTIQETEDRLGNVERLTVAALVDLKPGGEKGPSGMTIQDVQDIIRQSIGIRANRDEIKVSDVRLAAPLINPSAVEAELERIQFWQNTVAIVRWSSLAVLGLVTLLVLGSIIRRLLPPPTKAPEPPPAPPPASRVAASAKADPEAIARALAAYLSKAQNP